MTKVSFFSSSLSICFRGMLVALAVVGSMAGCHTTNSSTQLPWLLSTRVQKDSSLLESCPYLCRDNQGRLVLSWVSQLNFPDSPGHLYFAVSPDNGQTFGEPSAVPTAVNIEPNGEDMPKMIFLKSGRMVATYVAPHVIKGNPYAGRVFYTWSDDQGKTWSPATAVTRDTGSYDQRYFDLAELPDGKLGIVWLNNSTIGGSTLCFARMEETGAFSVPQIIADHTCQCCRTDLFVDKAGEIHLAWRAILSGSIRDVVYSVSTDDGRSFSSPVRISPDNWVLYGCPHSGPSMTPDDHSLYFAWYSGGGGSGIYFCRSGDDGRTFSTRVSLSHNPSSRHPQIVTLPNGNLVIAWDEWRMMGIKHIHGLSVQERSGSGAVLREMFIAPYLGEAGFEAIKPLNDHEVLLAYVREDGKLSVVNFQDVPL